MSKNWVAKDTLTKSGAEDLAAKIKAYWMGRGYFCEVWIERISERPDIAAGAATIYAIRSDMVNGLPREADANVDF